MMMIVEDYSNVHCIFCLLFNNVHVDIDLHTVSPLSVCIQYIQCLNCLSICAMLHESLRAMQTHLYKHVHAFMTHLHN